MLSSVPPVFPEPGSTSLTTPVKVCPFVTPTIITISLTIVATHALSTALPVKLLAKPLLANPATLLPGLMLPPLLVMVYLFATPMPITMLVTTLATNALPTAPNALLTEPLLNVLSVTLPPGSTWLPTLAMESLFVTLMPITTSPITVATPALPIALLAMPPLTGLQFNAGPVTPLPGSTWPPTLVMESLSVTPPPITTSLTTPAMPALLTALPATPLPIGLLLNVLPANPLLGSMLPTWLVMVFLFAIPMPITTSPITAAMPAL